MQDRPPVSFRNQWNRVDGSYGTVRNNTAEESFFGILKALVMRLLTHSRWFGILTAYIGWITWGSLLEHIAAHPLLQCIEKHKQLSSKDNRS